MPMPAGFQDFVTQVGQLYGLNPQGKGYGQSIDNALRNTMVQKMFQSGVTPQQAAQSWTSMRSYNDLMDPYKGVGSTGMRDDQAAIDIANDPNIKSGKVVWNAGENRWVPTASAGVKEPSRPAWMAGMSFFDNDSILKDPNLKGFTPETGMYTSQANIKQPRSGQILDAISGMMPLLLLAPALGAVMPGLSGLVGAGSKAVGGGKPGPGQLLSLLKLFGGFGG